jgi:hypothetical protein
MNSDRSRAHPRPLPQAGGEKVGASRSPSRLREGLGVGLLAVLPLLAGCASVPSLYEEPTDAKFGEANRQTMMAQVIDPDPVYEGPAVTSGEHAAGAVERYRTDTVKEPESVSTTSGAGGGSSGSGSN